MPKPLESKFYYSFLMMIFALALSGPLDSHGAQARNFSEKIKGGQIHYQVPRGWERVRDLYGMPLTLLGPSKKGVRPVLSITTSKAKIKKFDFEDPSHEFDEYQRSRKDWAKRKGARVLSFRRLRQLTWRGFNQVFTAGFSYNYNNRVFNEDSFYALCRGRLVFLKALAPQTLSKKQKYGLDRLIESLRCQN